MPDSIFKIVTYTMAGLFSMMSLSFIVAMLYDMWIVTAHYLKTKDYLWAGFTAIGSISCSFIFGVFVYVIIVLIL